MFGLSISAEGPLRRIWAFMQAVLTGKTHGVSLAIGASTLVVILLLKRRPRIPGVLVAVVGATLVVAAFDLGARAGVSVLGSLPQGLPSLTIPFVDGPALIQVLIG